MEKFSLRGEKKPKAAAHHELLKKVPGGTLPMFKPNTVVYGKLHESEVKDLKALGVQEGDPLPPDFAKRLQEVREETAADLASGEFQGVSLPAFRVPEEIPVSKLPPEKRKEIEGLLAAYKEAVPAIEAAAKASGRTQEVLASLPPTIQKTLKEAMLQDSVEVVDSRPHKMAEAPPPPDDLLEKPKAQMSHCPHCRFALDKPPPAEPTSSDTENFVIATLGGQPFLKEYKFFGDRLIITLRSVSARNSFLVPEQLSRDQRDNKVLNLDDLLRLGLAYRTVLLLYSVRHQGGLLQVGPAVDDVLKDPPAEVLEKGEATPLPYLLERLQNQEPLSSETVWGLIAKSTQDFNELTTTLTNRADHPDFLTATGG